MKQNKELFSHLNAISNASDQKKADLIKSFKLKFPQELQWLEMIEEPSNQTISEQFLPEIKGYQVSKSIGSGANGTVYLATDSQNNAVAIKTPNIWLNDDQIARFIHEGKLLSRLVHPNIAQVLDVGEFSTPQGKMPYIVLEYINGINIDQYCKKHQLGAESIVKLFKNVLAAIQFSHQKRVIHRDIKPDNIIVDSNGVPKLLDFGIATLDAEATHAMTQLTKTGEIVGTLAYMSPEQISGSHDLDSRTDIYSCGVVLYELISGHLPFEVDARQFFSAVNKILHETPKNITAFNQQIDDSLAAVIHHAIEKKPDSRFQTAHDFLKDLTAWESGDPIQSQQLSKWYWIKQAAKKNKALVTGTALAFLGLVTGLVFAVSFALKEKEARTLADQKAESNRQVIQFINDLFVNADPTESLGETITVKQVIQGAQYSVNKDLANEPQVEAQIRLVLGNVFDAIEVYPSALAQYQKGLARLNNKEELYFELATQRIKTLASSSQYDQLMQATSQLKSELSKSQLTESEVNAFNNKIMFQEATFYINNSQIDKALSLINQLKQQTDLDLSQQFAINKYRGYIHRDVGEFDLAEQLFRSELEKAKLSFGELHPVTLDLIQELALTLRQKNQIDDALVLYDQLILGLEKNYGENSLSILLAKINKATAYMYAGDFAKADEMTADLLPKMIKHVGSMHQYTLALRNIRGGALDNVGKWDEALALYQESLDLFLQSEVKDNFNIINIPHNMAVIYNKQKRINLAHETYQTYRPKCESMLTLENPLCIIMADSHADILIQLGEYQKAEELLAYSNPALIEKYGADHPRVAASNARLDTLKTRRLTENSSNEIR